MTWGETGGFGRNLPCASADDDMACCGVLFYVIVLCGILRCRVLHCVVIVAVDVVGVVLSGVGEVQCAVSFCVLACRGIAC